MKLKDWADKQGISYLTAWRWFKAGDPRLSRAYQSDSGTIIVPEDTNTSEPLMNNIQDSDIMAVVLKKTVEFSRNEYAIEDFTAWLLSNFTLKLRGVPDSPKYTKVKPKSEEVQKHFQQFLKPKGEKPKANMFVTTDPEALDELMVRSDDLTAQELVEEIHKIGADGGVSVNPNDAPEVGELMKDLSSALNPLNPPNLGIFQSSLAGSVKTYGNVAEGVVTRSVDLTPQHLNYTGSASPALSNVSFNSALNVGEASSSCFVASSPTITSAVFLGESDSRSRSFQPTQKELDSVNRMSSITEKPRRGRKRSKITGNE
jgi:hypothetical protein